jgi:hypothetical protein
MDLKQIAIPIGERNDYVELFRLLRELRVPMDPCAGEPRFDADASGRQRLIVIVDPRIERALREAGRSFEVVRDLADVRDPREFVSRTNRYAAELARLRAAKPRRR